MMFKLRKIYSYVAYLGEFGFVCVQNVVLKRIEEDFKHLRQEDSWVHYQGKYRYVNKVSYGAIPHPNAHHSDRIRDNQKL